jgi:16S rRNA A1518/A1519 N6-dimethyltransferase RsmA/KsgA/DIM1 with predicted DNA glycosylase/AP lyase activity
MKHVARKRFGQNFLHDRIVLDDITAPSRRSRTMPWSRSAPAWAP